MGVGFPEQRALGGEGPVTLTRLPVSVTVCYQVTRLPRAKAGIKREEHFPVVYGILSIRNITPGLYGWLYLAVWGEVIESERHRCI